MILWPVWFFVRSVLHLLSDLILLDVVWRHPIEDPCLLALARVRLERMCRRGWEMSVIDDDYWLWLMRWLLSKSLPEFVEIAELCGIYFRLKLGRMLKTWEKLKLCRYVLVLS